MANRNSCGQNIARLLNKHDITLMTLLVQLHEDGFPMNYRHLQIEKQAGFLSPISKGKSVKDVK
jgi:hypothetical protein